ncbi:hypothetical protein D3C72_2240660 [compost metagenome]
MLGDVGHVGALVQPLDEPAAAAGGAAVIVQAGQELDQLVGEPGERARRLVVQVLQIDDGQKGRAGRPDVGTTQDALLENLHGAVLSS